MNAIRCFPTRRPIKSRSELEIVLGAAAQQVLASIDFQAPNELVLASGSLVEGLGNAQSDLDVFVVTPSRDKSSRIIYCERLGRWLDEVRITCAEMRELQNSVTRRKNICTAWGSVAPLSYNTTDRYYRLAIGIPLNDPYAESGHFPPGGMRASAVREDVILGAISAARQLWVDAVGALESGHMGQARVAARLGIERVVDAYGAIFGELYHGEKWRWARLSRATHDPLEFRPLIDSFGAANGPREAEDDVVDLAERMLRVMWLAEYGERLDFWPKHGPFERFELQSKEILHVDSLGKFKPVDASQFKASVCEYS